MKASRVPRILAWTAAAVAGLIVLTGGLIAAIDAGYGRSLLIWGFAVRLGREIQVNGAVHARLLSRTPEIIAEQVIIGNPAWMPAGRTAEVGKLTLVLQLPAFDHPGGLVRLAMQDAVLHLVRNADGHANWQITDPARKTLHGNSPIIRSLSVPDARVEVADARRHLQFVGTVSASAPQDFGTPQAVRIAGAGVLNGRTATFGITADPLTTASHTDPYHFTFSEHSGGSRIEGRGVLPQPFAFGILDADFDAAGPDLKDLYFLAGVHLIDTGAYHLSGRFSRRGARTEFSDVAMNFGHSDLRGRFSVELAQGERTVDLDLRSRNLRLADVGLRAAGRATGPNPPWLLSDARISLNVLRIGKATVMYRAAQVQVGRLALQDVSARASLDGGVLTVAPLTATVLGGRADGQLMLDARKEVPAATVDLGITDLQLGRFPYKGAGPAPLEGPLRVRVVVKGTGLSVHQVAASATGTVTAQVRAGKIRESLAELTGLDLRGLGLLLTGSTTETPMRCAVASFKAHDGTLVVQRLVADTDPVMITGEGLIHMDSETLDLKIHGTPKGTRLLRLRAPVLIQGTLGQPSVHIQKEDSRLVLVDPGREEDADCSTLPDGAHS